MPPRNRKPGPATTIDPAHEEEGSSPDSGASSSGAKTTGSDSVIGDPHADELAPDEAARVSLDELGMEHHGVGPVAGDVAPPVGTLADEWRDELRPIVHSINFSLGAPLTLEDVYNADGSIRWDMTERKCESVIRSASEAAAARKWQPRKSIGSWISLAFELLDHFAPRYKAFRDAQAAAAEEPTQTEATPEPMADPAAPPIQATPAEGVAHGA